jgi:hypothetical protein
MFPAPVTRKQHSLFDYSYVPSVGLTDGPYELGVRVTMAATGAIVGVRFWKVSGDSNTSRTVRVWAGDGTQALLSSCLTSNETAAGWQYLALETPVAVVSGGVYIVSRNVSAVTNAVGFIASFYTSASSRGPLIASNQSGAQSALGGQNTFPGTFNDTFTGCDLVFEER